MRGRVRPGPAPSASRQPGGGRQGKPPGRRISFMNHHPCLKTSGWTQLRRAVLTALLLGAGIAIRSPLRAAEPATPKVGGPAPNFVLQTLDQKPVELNVLTAKTPVVLVVLRGWPGYQCPLCTKQVQDFVSRAPDFRARGVQVLMVYPGPAEKLAEHAQEFLGNKQWPEEFLFALDPDYELTRKYGLRWEAKKETAYPSTFIIDREGKVRFAYVSKSHGDRVSAARALAELK